MPQSRVSLFKHLFFQGHAFKSTFVVVGLFICGLLEGIGIAILLPIIGILSSGSLAQSQEMDPLSAQILEAVSYLGLPVQVEWLLFFMAFFITAKAALSIFIMNEVGRTAAFVTADFRERLIRGALQVRWPVYVRLPLGRVSAALGPEAQRVSEYYLITCIAIADLLQTLIYFALSLLIAWKISLVALIAGFFVIFGLRGLVKLTRSAGEQQTSSLGSLLKQLTDALGSVKAIKAMGREHHYAGLLKTDIALLQQAQHKSHYSIEFLRLIREPVVVVFIAVGLYFALNYYDASFSELGVLALVFMRMAMKFLSIQSNYQRMSEQESAFASMYSLIESLEDKQEEVSGTQKPQLKRAITFRDVCFSYDSDPSCVLIRNFSANFPSEKLSVIVGPSGSGKTTLLDLMIGFYGPNAGDILIDDTPIQDLDRIQWRRRISYVPQDSGLFHDTIWNNIALGDEAVHEDAIWRALEKSGAADFVRALPQGLYENVGERGQRLSGGQRQRIAIARALVRDPLLLLLDEPTSALDPENEKALMQVLKDLSQDITIIMITHNLHLRSYADHVVDLSKREAGRHE